MAQKSTSLLKIRLYIYMNITLEVSPDIQSDDSKEDSECE